MTKALLHERRDLVDLDERAALEPELGDEAAVGRVELRRLARLVLVEHLDRRTRAGAADERPARVAEADGEGDEKKAKSDAEPRESSGGADGSRLARTESPSTVGEIGVRSGRMPD